MKRYFLFVVAAMLCLPMVAGTTIQREFYGCELGKSSKMECMIKCLETGVITGADNFSLAFDGKYVVDGYEFRSTATTFQNDTLFMVAFSDTLVSEHPEAADAFLNRLKARYNDIPGSGFDDLMGKAFLDTLCTQGNIDTSRVWSKAYGPTMVILVLNEDRFGLIYLDIDFLWRKFYKSFMDGFSSLLGPDYDPANEVKGVAGMTFGDSKVNVRSRLIAKYGQPLDENMHEMQYHNITIGGTPYSFVTFYFKENAETHKYEFVAASMEKSYNSWEDEQALRLFKSITAQYSNKYTNETKKVNTAEEKVYVYGKLVDDNYYPIRVSMKKGLSRGGDIRYYVTVSYNMHRLANLYDDEI